MRSRCTGLRNMESHRSDMGSRMVLNRTTAPSADPSISAWNKDKYSKRYIPLKRVANAFPSRTQEALEVRLGLSRGGRWPTPNVQALAVRAVPRHTGQVEAALGLRDSVLSTRLLHSTRRTRCQCIHNSEAGRSQFDYNFWSGIASNPPEAQDRNLTARGSKSGLR